MNAVLPLLLAAAVAASPAESSLRRYALIVGANDGGAARIHLRYAESDATTMDRVLRELGGIAESDRLLVLNPDRAGFLNALARVRTMLSLDRPAGVTTELLVYYSGHSDDRGLLLKEERVPYEELRQILGELQADVRIAILDSCASGELTRFKGGQRKPAFLVDSSNHVKGHAFLTSSSADEVAQESDRIGSSFFTHALLSGLRGAADTSGDGRVTLNEAYQFAFNETLARTEQTIGGAQHPSYDIQLVGSGDVVMTDLRDTSAGLHLPKALDGRLSIRDASGHLVVELEKHAGHPIDLALEPGPYQVMLDRNGQLSRAPVTLAEGKREVLDTSKFTAVAGEATASRGSEPEVETYHVAPVTLGILYLGVPVKTVNYFELNLFVGGTTRLTGVSLSSLGAWIDEDAYGLQLSGLFNHEGRSLTGVDLSGITNIAGGQVKGLQGSGVVNYSGPLQGAQLAGTVNLANGEVVGLQAGGVLNLSGPLSGAQFSGVANIAAGPLHGLQGAGFFNVSLGGTGAWLSGAGNVTTGDARGLAATGFFNWHQGELLGAQLSGGFNFASKMTGAQLSTINVAGELAGPQFGVVNIGGKVSSQFGVVNIADEVDATVGLISVSRKGTFAGGFWTGDTAPMNLGLKMGGKTVYSILSLAWDPRAGSPQVSEYIGVGFHIPVVGNLWIDPDFGTGSGARSFATLFNSPGSLLSKVRLNVGYSFFPHLSVVGGVALDVQVRLPGSALQDLSYGWAGRSGTVSWWPSPYLGLQI
jgi:hypothetical protein